MGGCGWLWVIVHHFPGDCGRLWVVMGVWVVVGGYG